jgi:hypothetical protein
MSALRGAAAGTLGLTALYALISTRGAAENAGTLFTVLTGAVRRLVDPTVPLIPDRTGTTTHKQIILAN